jgi:asparagine synthase (glutamine-hydrolysing)
MCGLCGEVRFRGRIDLAANQRMAETLHPRGPDAGGAFAQGNIVFGHRRLSILDLSGASQQPMVDSELGLALVFNGCIYNFRELRRELSAKGYRFFSDGDTEVILKAYHAWGPRCVERFLGMFAFAIWERDSDRVVLVRDRLGIKPLYLADIDNGCGVRFASTLPALLAAGGVDTAIDPASLHNYMSFHAVVPAPRTILKGVRKLPPATILTIEPDGTRREDTYWTVEFGSRPEDRGRTEEDWREAVLASLRTAVERRRIADVPVGVLLSGGLDSSLVVALLKDHPDLKTFSIGFESVGGVRGDEFQYSDLVAQRFGTEHHRIHIDGARALDAMPGVVKAMSEPMMSHDAIGFYLLAEEVSKHVKVVQSGQGADEIFGGYHWYPRMLQANDPVGEYARVYFDRDHDEMGEALVSRYMNGDYSRDFVDNFFARAGATRAIDKALQIDTQVMLVDDPVKRVDNMTMAWGLEARVPFLDHELVELAARIPAELKVRDGGKSILKDAARAVVPAEVIDRPKGYFPVPALKYLRGPFLAMVRDVLGSRKALERGLFNPNYVERLLADPEGNLTPKGHSKLWQVALLESWLQTHGI